MIVDGRYIQEEVDKHYPNALMFEGMRVWSLPKNKEHMLAEVCGNGEYFGQIKKDGNFYQFVTTADRPYLFSRNESKETGLLTEKIDNVPHIVEALKLLPPNTVVLGEIYFPGMTSNEVRTVMGCLPAKALKRQKESGWVKFYIFDIIFFNGTSLLGKGAWDRFNFLKAVFEKLELGKSGHIELAETYTDNLFERIGAALEAGEEGMVLKKKDYPYIPGKKPAWSMIKVKQVDYADVLCVGFEPATKIYDGKEIETWEYWENTETGEKLRGQLYNSDLPVIPITKPYFNGWVGSILIGAYDIHGNIKSIGSVSSGLTDGLREQIRQNPNDFIGKVCMVQCMEKFEETLRHPIFKGFRDDKPARECTIESIFG